VILRDMSGNTVHGLTTAATIWLAACLGAACGLGYLSVAATASAIALLILILGVPFERRLRRTEQDHARLHDVER
ncbi:MAG: MgtC/SapB family protein, partial [Gemmatimonadaceae bacterium]